MLKLKLSLKHELWLTEMSAIMKTLWRCLGVAEKAHEIKNFIRKQKKRKKKRNIYSESSGVNQMIQWLFYSVALEVPSFHHKIVTVMVMLSAYLLNSAMKSWEVCWWYENARQGKRKIIVFLTMTYCRPVICDDFIGKGIEWSICDIIYSNRSAIQPKILWITTISVGRRKLSFFQQKPLAF